MLRTSLIFITALSTLLLGGCDLELPESKTYSEPSVETAQPVALKDTRTDDGARELTWDDLVPEDWRPTALLKEFNVDEMKYDDPRVEEYEARLRQLWDVAPVVKELEGQLIKLPGYVVPIEDNGKKVTEFLLVPYHGACIHVPAPPANQTVYVITGDAEAKIRKAFDTVWVTGIVKLEKVDRELAITGYTIHATKVEPYE